MKSPRRKPARKPKPDYATKNDLWELSNDLSNKIIGLAYALGYEPVSLFKRRYDADQLPHFEWREIPRHSKERK